jgi:uncharacterized protein (TIGR02284 family)
MHKPEQILNDLIATCRDSEEGWASAAKLAREDELRAWMEEVSRTRADFAEQLEERAQRLGFQTEDSGHAGGPLHKGWIDLESRVRPSTDLELLDACLKGERETVSHYTTALARPEFPEGARDLVEEQLREIQRTVEELALALASVLPAASTI